MSSPEAEDDPAFAALPSTLKRRIDDAFDAAISSRKRKRHKPATPQPGGFLVDDVPAGGFLPDELAPGGFMPHEHSPLSGADAGGSSCDDSPASPADEESNPVTHIPLSSIPAALQILDLQPDDEDVLAVFQNAATGWGNHTRTHPQADSAQDALVSRKDWRAVCAALLDTSPSDDDILTAHDPAPTEGLGEPLEDLSDLTADSAEEYVDSEGTDSGSDDSDGDYQPGGFVPSKSTRGTSAVTASQTEAPQPSKARRPRTRKSSFASSAGSGDDGTHTRLTARQKKECRIAFALFFPDVVDEELDRQRIRVHDVTRVAKLLKEKLSAEETVEMLEAFSTAPDKSMGLADFERMMVAARMA